MAVSIFAGCTDSCGWIAAVISMISFGSFGVPLKSKSIKDLEADPLVMQSYKTFVCFVTCWLVLLIGEEIRWTPWGIVSGLFWVPGASCGIYGIRNAGLAIAVGTWSSIIVISSFLWGIVIFQEGVKDFFATGCAFTLLLSGLLGMSMYAKPPPSSVVNVKKQLSLKSTGSMDENAIEESKNIPRGKTAKMERQNSFPEHSDHSSVGSDLHDSDYEGDNDEMAEFTNSSNHRHGASPQQKTRRRRLWPFRFGSETSNENESNKIVRTSSETPQQLPQKQSKAKKRVKSISAMEIEPLIKTEAGEVNEGGGKSGDVGDSIILLDTPGTAKKQVYGIDDFYDKESSSRNVDKTTLVLFSGRVALSKRQLGVIGAIINGVWGGTCLIPMHFAAREGFSGAAYLISFASGSLLVNIWIFIVLYFYYAFTSNFDFYEAYDLMPKFYIKELWKPGLLAGILYSCGNFGSILSVTYLGQGVGYSLCQCQILISGLWGIFYYKEISGQTQILKWFISAIVTIAGILWLSYEHKSSMAHR